MKRSLFYMLALSGLVGQAPAMAADAGEPRPRAGMTCTVPDGWWSLDPRQPEQAETVLVVALRPLVTAEPGAWVQPQRGQLTGYQYLIPLARLRACRAA